MVREHSRFRKRMLDGAAAVVWILITGLLFGCQRAPGHQTGVIAIQLVQIEGARLTVQLKNGTSTAVGIRGSRSGRVVIVDPTETYIDCFASSGATRFQSGPRSAFEDEVVRIEIAPGLIQMLAVDIDLSVGSQNSQCRLYLKLQNGQLIESEPFRR